MKKPRLAPPRGNLLDPENPFPRWNRLGLPEKGPDGALGAGRVLSREGFVFDVAYTSVLKRAIKTLWLALEEMDLMWLPYRIAGALMSGMTTGAMASTRRKPWKSTAWSRSRSGGELTTG